MALRYCARAFCSQFKIGESRFEYQRTSNPRLAVSENVVFDSRTYGSI
jgi:hypothetical protein